MSTLIETKKLALKDLIGKEGLLIDGDWVESKDQDPDGSVRLIQLADIGVGEFLNKSSRFMTKEKALDLKCTFLQPGDILIARMPDPIGRACIFPGLDQECVTVVDVSILRIAKSDVIPSFVVHAINSPALQRLIAKYIRGSTRKRISRKNLESLEITVPEPKEQVRVAGVLNRIDNARAVSNVIKDQLMILCDAIFWTMFVKECAETWETTFVEKVALDKKGSMRTGPFGSQLLHSEFVDQGIAVLGIDNVVDNKFGWNQRRFITEEKYDQLRRYRVYPGDVLISIMGTCGRCAVVPDDIPLAINTKHLCCITLDQSRCLPEYLQAYFLTHPLAKQYLKSKSKGAIMDGLNMQIIKEMPLLLPPLALQQTYRDSIEKIKKMQVTRLNSLKYQEELLMSVHNKLLGA